MNREVCSGFSLQLLPKLRAFGLQSGFPNSNFTSAPTPFSLVTVLLLKNNSTQLFHLHLLLTSLALSLIMLSAAFPNTCLALELFVAVLGAVLGDKMIFLSFVMPETVFF